MRVVKKRKLRVSETNQFTTFEDDNSWVLKNQPKVDQGGFDTENY